MQWILHGKLTPAVAEAFKRHGDQVHTMAELGLPAHASTRDIVWTANKKQWDMVTTDSTLIHWILDDRFPFKRSIVFLQLEGADVEQNDAIDRLFARYKRLTPGRLYTVTASRVKIRQIPTGGKPRNVDSELSPDIDLDEDEE